MRPDLAAIEAEVERKRAERMWVEEYKPQLVDELRENRLLVGMICEPWVLELCEDVQLDDFTEYRHQIAFKLIRRQQHTEGDFTVARYLEALDTGTSYESDVVVDMLHFLGVSFVDRAPFVGERCVKEYCSILRRLAERRSAL